MRVVVIQPAHATTHNIGGGDVLASHATDKVIATVDVTNTAVETDLYRKTIAANQMGANGCLKLNLKGDALINAAQTGRLRVKFGATTLFDTGAAIAPTASAVRHWWTLRVEVQNAGVTNAQRAHAHWWQPQPSASFTILAINAADNVMAEGDATSAEDTTLAKDLAVTMLWSAALATLSYRVLDGELLLFA